MENLPYPPEYAPQPAGNQQPQFSPGGQPIPASSPIQPGQPGFVQNPGNLPPGAAPFAPPMGPGYIYPQARPTGGSGMAVAGFMVSLLGLFLLLCPLSVIGAFFLHLRVFHFAPGPVALFSSPLSLVASILGLIFSILGRKSAARRGLAITGIVLSSVVLGLTLLLIVILIISYIVYLQTRNY